MLLCVCKTQNTQLFKCKSVLSTYLRYHLYSTNAVNLVHTSQITIRNRMLPNQFYSIYNISTRCKIKYEISLFSARYPISNLQMHCFRTVQRWIYPQESPYMNHALAVNYVDVKACITFPSATSLCIALAIDLEIKNPAWVLL